MSFVSTDPQNHQGENTWFTPQEFIQKLGPFILDPCTVSYRPFDTADFHIEFDKNENGLDLIWRGDVWLNPPYGKEIVPFVEKFNQHKMGVMLVFARMGSIYIQESLKNGAYIFCLRKRISFIRKDGVKATNAGADSCLVFYDKKYIKKISSSFEGVLIKQERES